METIVSWPVAGFLGDRLGRRKPVSLARQLMSAAVSVALALGVPRLGAAGVANTACAGLSLPETAARPFGAARP